MIIYRPHKGTLVDSMAEAKEFNTIREMKEYIVKEWDSLFSIDDIVFENGIINDDRTGWKDTRYVCITRLGKDDYIKAYAYPQCIGMCATDYKR